MGKDTALRHVVYGVLVSSEDRVECIDVSAKFSKEEFYNQPEKYRSTFAEKVRWLLPPAALIVLAVSSIHRRHCQLYILGRETAASSFKARGETGFRQWSQSLDGSG